MKSSSSSSRYFLILRLLLPPTLIAFGLTIFTQSFFLSRTSFDHRSSCEHGAAGSLLKDALDMNEDEIRFLRETGWLSDYPHNDEAKRNNTNNNGCWVPRKVDSMAIIVVDALRFDFARDHLPLSVGSRLFPFNGNKTRGFSKLYQFVADPPTVTMQRLKGLTTGGLPTFADITGSFGGASVEEDSWVEQLKDAPWEQRHGMRTMFKNHKPQIAFVGDDTWIDLFPTQFDDSHPYPSFNTRDLDTVDNGCLLHLPRILNRLAGLKSNHSMNEPLFELMVAHFLGVDHVGHTYGPKNPHMEKKLQQMDEMLSNTLDRIDNATDKSCVVALVLGDHGMTEDGNHGGGTSEEVNAGLFVHFSPGCNAGKGYDQRIDGQEVGSEYVQAFDSIHQIDLVPTISLLLGLPIPYANIGGLITAILPTRSDESLETVASSTPKIATALALNAAQVWTYLHTYSKTSRDLPKDRLLELKELLDSAATLYRGAIQQSQRENMQDSYHDSIQFRQACGLFKIFLAESTGLGKQVWTQFNEKGMMIGIATLFLGWILANPLWKRDRKQIGMTLGWFGIRFTVEREGSKNVSVTDDSSEEQIANSLTSFRLLELVASIIFMTFYSCVLTFGNSYIEHEREIVTFFLAILCLLLFRRWYYVSNKNATSTASAAAAAAALVAPSACLPLVVILCTRIHDMFVTGHGLDPSIRLHASHNALIFLPSLALLAALRLRWFEATQKKFLLSELIDVLAMACLACSWWDKRTQDHSKNGHYFARAAMLFVIVGVMHSVFCIACELATQGSYNQLRKYWKLVCYFRLILFRVMLFLVVVTGPSTASTAVLVLVQCAALSQMMVQSKEEMYIDAPVMAAIWRLLVRQIFFATNHHCSFNRLHFTAAFVATDTFQFHIAGFSLFMNTFGWEFLGSTLLLLTSRFTTSFTTADNTNGPSLVWDWFCFYQCTETLTSCISVSAMKRHLMVWAVFAPRFMFATIFTGLGLVFWFVDALVQGLLEQSDQTGFKHVRLPGEEEDRDK